MSSTFALSLLSEIILHVDQSSPLNWKRIFVCTIVPSKRKATNNIELFCLFGEKKSSLIWRFLLQLWSWRGQYNRKKTQPQNKRQNSSLDFNPFFFFWNMQSHPCLFTFFCQLRIRKCFTVNFICSETSCDFLQNVRNFLHCLLSRHKNTSKKKELILQWKSPNKLTHFKTF